MAHGWKSLTFDSTLSSRATKHRQADLSTGNLFSLCGSFFLPEPKMRDTTCAVNHNQPTPMTAASQFKILGICDNVNACDCCGKSNLQKTVAIENCETGTIGYFGTSCAMHPSKCFGFEKKEMNAAINSFKSKANAYYYKVSRIYKERGGKRIQVEYAKNSWGAPLYESRYADIALRDAIIAELGPIVAI